MGVLELAVTGSLGAVNVGGVGGIAGLGGGVVVVTSFLFFLIFGE